MKKLTTEQFIARAKLVHGDRYDYSEVNYVNGNTSVTIICPIHGIFKQNPQVHLKGGNCVKCNGINKSKYTVEYINNHLPATIKLVGTISNIHTHSNVLQCIKCGHNWKTFVVSFILNKSGCPVCDREHSSLTFDGISNRLASKNIQLLKMTKEPKLLLEVRCNLCSHTWKALSSNLLYRTSCPKCSQRVRVTCESVRAKLDNRPIRLISKSILSIKHKVWWECVECNHQWKTTVDSVINKSTGCPRCCNSRQYSIKGEGWLEHISKHIEDHIEREYQFDPSNKKLKADGYCKETNTIYEFHGDYWHGNPSLYEPLFWNDMVKKTMGELYQKTKEREDKIKSLGYNLVVMWENDWNKLNKEIL